MTSFLFVYLGVLSLAKAHVSEVPPFPLSYWALQAALRGRSWPGI